MIRNNKNKLMYQFYFKKHSLDFAYNSDLRYKVQILFFNRTKVRLKRILKYPVATKIISRPQTYLKYFYVGLKRFPLVLHIFASPQFNLQYVGAR